MFKDIKETMEKHLGHINPDVALYKKLKNFRIAWGQKSEVYIEYLGSNLLGVHEIRFSSQDDELLMVDILNVDMSMLASDLKETKGIDKSWQIATNPVYMSLAYLMYKYYHSSVSKHVLEDVLKELYYIFAYKVTGSLYFSYFKYPVPVDIAKAVYERLTNRYLIKRLGSWQKFYEYRAQDVLPPKGLHVKKFKKYTTEDSVNLVNDLQGRIREAIKNLYKILVEVTAEKEGIKSSSLNANTDEGESIKDITDRPDKYILYVKSILNKRNDFINDDLIYLVKQVLPNLDEDNFYLTLKYITDHVDIEKNPKDDFVEVAISQTMMYLRTKDIIGEYEKYTMEALTYMKGYWSSSSVKDPNVKHIKEYLFKIARKATGKKTKWLLATITIGVLLYIFLRSLYRNN